MISIFIPVFNEEKHIQAVIANTLRAAKRAGEVSLDIIIVNDASTDQTAQIIADLEKRYSFIRSIHHKQNQGIGIGIKEAIKIAKYPKFMIVPGDDDAAQDLLTDLMKHRNDAEIIFSYYLNKEIRGRKRNILSTIYGLIYMTVFNVYIQYINCPVVYPTAKLKKLNIQSKRFSFTAEINIKLLRLGCTYHEIPGYMQTGLDQSTSFKLKNLWEVFVTFIKLVNEINFTDKAKFNHYPKRIKVQNY